MLLNRLAVLKTVKDSPYRLVHHRLSTACLFIRVVACPVLSFILYTQQHNIHTSYFTAIMHSQFLNYIGEQIVMRQHDALRFARCAGAARQQCHVILSINEHAW